MSFYLVTGGAGFIGSNLVREVLRRGHRARVLDNFSTGHLRNLQEVAEEIELHHDDVRDPLACRAAVQGVDFVLHQAALGSVPRSVADPIPTHESNVTGTLNLLIAAREAGVKRFVFASSSSVYGNSDAPRKVETLPTLPLSPYATSKLAAESFEVA